MFYVLFLPDQDTTFFLFFGFLSSSLCVELTEGTLQTSVLVSYLTDRVRNQLDLVKAGSLPCLFRCGILAVNTTCGAP